MTAHNKLNELNPPKTRPGRRPLERLGWIYVP
jgi:hypothetical protein